MIVGAPGEGHAKLFAVFGSSPDRTGSYHRSDRMVVRVESWLWMKARTGLGPTVLN